MSDQWTACETRLPPEDMPVMTRIDDEHGIRHETTLKRCGNMWWLKSGSMYVYDRPTHWRPLR